MIIGPIIELELPKHNDVVPEELFNEKNILQKLFLQSFYGKYFH